jgi:riboflavin synthase
MFTGIVEERGSIASVTPLVNAAQLAIHGAVVLADVRPGDSIAVNGVCLTVVELGPDYFTADVMDETLQRSSLKSAQAGTAVNLERAARLDSRLGGHLVQGHVDGTGEVVSIRVDEHWTVMQISLPKSLNRYVVEKGSITVDGVSLTVMTIDEHSFSVSLIPTTLQETTLGTRRVGDLVNLEVDAIAKYVERLMQERSS